MQMYRVLNQTKRVNAQVYDLQTVICRYRGHIQVLLNRTKCLPFSLFSAWFSGMDLGQFFVYYHHPSSRDRTLPL